MGFELSAVCHLKEPTKNIIGTFYELHLIIDEFLFLNEVIVYKVEIHLTNWIFG